MTGFQSKRNATRDKIEDCCTYRCEQGRDCPVRMLTYRYPRTLRQAFPEDADTMLPLELTEPGLDEKSLWPDLWRNFVTLCAAIGWFALACALTGYAWYRSVA